jgi:hypothetical protein
MFRRGCPTPAADDAEESGNASLRAGLFIIDLLTKKAGATGVWVSAPGGPCRHAGKEGAPHDTWTAQFYRKCPREVKASYRAMIEVTTGDAVKPFEM